MVLSESEGCHVWRGKGQGGGDHSCAWGASWGTCGSHKQITGLGSLQLLET